MQKYIRKWWFWALIAFFAIGITNGIRVTFSGGPETPAAAPAVVSSESTDDKAIQKSVDALIDSSNKGDGYLCDVLTKSDGSGYIVSLQINVSAGPPESTALIESLESSIKALNNSKIVEIQIDALKDGKIIDHN